MAENRLPIFVLHDHLRFHAETEGKILQEYVEVTNGTKSKALRYIVDLIVKDEHRHHQIFRELESAIGYAIGAGGSGTAVPALDFDRVDGTETLEIVDRLLRFELEDRRELKDLRKQFQSFDDTSLYGLLVELMQRDTDKHIAILQFAKKHTKKSINSLLSS